MKKFVLETSKDILINIGNEEEIEIFELFSDSIYLNIKNKRAFKDNDASGFGDMQDIAVQIVIGIIIDLSKDAIKSGYALSVEKIKDTLNKNKEKYINKYNNKIIKEIEKNLSKKDEDDK